MNNQSGLMTYTITTILTIVEGRLLNDRPFDHPIEHLLLDSRRTSFPETSLFFAIAGQRHDGHDYLSAVYAAGVRNFVVTREVDSAAFPEANLVLVGRAVAALQQLAAYHRSRFTLPVIGITGSNGKTIVKEWLYQLLNEDYYLVRSPGSFNSQVGVPLSVWQLHSGHELALFEAGVSRSGEMARLAPIIRCTIGLLTNIGEAHSEGFASKEAKLREKLELFRYADIILCCNDDPLIRRTIDELDTPTLRWSHSGPADLRIHSTTAANGRTQIEADFRGEKMTVVVPFTDAASIENAIHCWLVLLHLGLAPAVIRRRMGALSALPMRLELQEGINGCILVNDSYNADLNSLDNALHFLEQQRRGGRRTLILSDILQSGMAQADLYARIARLLRERGIGRLFGIGHEVSSLAGLLPGSVESTFFPDTDAFLQALPGLEFRQEIILLKGARPFAFERIARRLAQQGHLTTLEIHLDAMVHNLNVYHRHLRSGVRMMVMVKAAAYGSGSVEVAKLLEFHRVDYLAVAYADEGIQLRQGGIGLPILVLNPEPATFEELQRFRLEPEVFSPGQMRQYGEFTATQREASPVHIKLDTGMHRLGFELHQLGELLELLREFPHLQVRSVFSHLSASEAAEHDAFTHEQAQRFQAMYEPIAAALGYRPLRHLLNTGGIVRFPEYQFDMVRLGIGIYGGAPEEELHPVFTLRTHISQIKDIPPGDSVGYGRRGRADHPRRIATIAIGYADGLPRAAGEGRFQVGVGRGRAPIVGSVCMDMSMIDITHLPHVREGDPVTIFGQAPGVEELAEATGTIPYEILTGISGRVMRVYVQE